MPFKNSLFVIFILASFIRVIGYESNQPKFYTDDSEQTEERNDIAEGADENNTFLFFCFEKPHTNLDITKKEDLIEYVFLQRTHPIRSIQSPPPDLVI
ncbi:MAG: hypothetical protein IPO98_09840 [Saprospiraceae bacterium]|nr:hypothetical protein [Saprospiraceae bacterium]